jgi:DNA-binding LytR/AlgR family response regulator
MSISCIAIDDEPLALELLIDNISRVPFLKLEKGFSNPIEALAYIKEHPVDLVILDIQMPGLTGLQFIQSLVKPPLFILITAYEQYALEGFNLNVVDYLVKPVHLDRFLKACDKVLEKKQAPAKPHSERDYMFVQADYKMIRINFKEILWIEGLKDYVKFHLASPAKPLVARMSMKSLEETLPASQFIRVHKSYIVAKDSITAFQKNILFVDNTEIPIGDSYKDAIIAFMGS